MKQESRELSLIFTTEILKSLALFMYCSCFTDNMNTTYKVLPHTDTFILTSLMCCAAAPFLVGFEHENPDRKREKARKEREEKRKWAEGWKWINFSTFRQVVIYTVAYLCSLESISIYLIIYVVWFHWIGFKCASPKMSKDNRSTKFQLTDMIKVMSINFWRLTVCLLCFF